MWALLIFNIVSRTLCIMEILQPPLFALRVIHFLCKSTSLRDQESGPFVNTRAYVRFVCSKRNTRAAVRQVKGLPLFLNRNLVKKQRSGRYFKKKMTLQSTWCRDKRQSSLLRTIALDPRRNFSKIYNTMMRAERQKGNEYDGDGVGDRLYLAEGEKELQTCTLVARKNQPK